ncbi:TPA: hypothetical protein EYG84_03330 [Candidatus Gracilibacteria bacterium]|nr:hypothetical protein [Candidatus Gracilibacteria bacterium]
MTQKQNDELDKLLESIKAFGKRQEQTDKMLSAKFAKTDEQMKETNEKIAQLTENVKKTGIEVDKTTLAVSELIKNVSGINNSIGEDAETLEVDVFIARGREGFITGFRTGFRKGAKRKHFTIK